MLTAFVIVLGMIAILVFVANGLELINLKTTFISIGMLVGVLAMITGTSGEPALVGTTILLVLAGGTLTGYGLSISK